MYRSFALKLGFEPRNDAHSLYLIPLGIAAGITVINLSLAGLGLVKYGYFSPYVAACAIISSRYCIRSGMVAAVSSVFMWNVLVLPPMLEVNLPTVAEAVAYFSAFVAAVATAPRKKTVATPSEAEMVPRKKDDGLPFTSKKRNGSGDIEASFWCVSPTYIWTDDDTVGREYGRIYVEALQRGEMNIPPLSYVVQDMIKGGDHTGMEAGFMSMVEKAAQQDVLDVLRGRSIRHHNTHYLNS